MKRLEEITRILYGTISFKDLDIENTKIVISIQRNEIEEERNNKLWDIKNALIYLANNQR